MFMQVMTGRVADREALDRQMERWEAELRPGATGFLGATGGVTDDGRAVLVARFDSAGSARANSERPEQDAWWGETEKAFDGPVTFDDSEDVEEVMGGGSDSATFVQVMRGRATDRAALERLEARFQPKLAAVHTGLLGSVRCWYGDDEFTEVIYFTSEAEARRGEQALGEDPEAADAMAEYQRLGPEPDFYDLRDPILTSG